MPSTITFYSDFFLVRLICAYFHFNRFKPYVRGYGYDYASSATDYIHKFICVALIKQHVDHIAVSI